MKHERQKSWRTLTARAWTAWIRQRDCGILISTPANVACKEIFDLMPEENRGILERFFLSDHQMPERFSAETGIPADKVLSVADEAGQRLIKALFGFEL